MSPDYDPNNADWWKGDDNELSAEDQFGLAHVALVLTGAALILGAIAMWIGWASIMATAGAACVVVATVNLRRAKWIK